MFFRVVQVGLSGPESTPGGSGECGWAAAYLADREHTSLFMVTFDFPSLAGSTGF